MLPKLIYEKILNYFVLKGWLPSGKESTCRAGEHLIPGLGRSPGEGNGSILAWEISWTEESDLLEPMGSQRAGHD